MHPALLHVEQTLVIEPLRKSEHPSILPNSDFRFFDSLIITNPYFIGRRFIYLYLVRFNYYSGGDK